MPPVKSLLIALLVSVTVGCSTNNADKNLLRPDLLIQYEPGSAVLSNAPVISEAVYSLLVNAHSEILVVGVSSDSTDYDPALAAERVQILTEQLNAAGIPDYKIHRMTKWGDGQHQIEIYGLENGWRSMPTDMMNFAFASNLPKRQLNVIQNTTTTPLKTQPVSQVIFKEGDFAAAVSDVVKQLGWLDVKSHLHTQRILTQAVIIDLKPIQPPVSNSVMEQILDAMLQESGVVGVSYRLHIAEKIVVLTEKKAAK